MILLCVLMLPFPVAAQNDVPQYDDIYRREDEEEVKIMFDARFNDILDRRNIREVASSWDYEVIGGSAKGDYGLMITDDSDKLPTYVKREIEPIESGVADMHFRLHFDRALTGFYLQANSGGKPIMHLEVKGTHLVAETPDGEDIIIIQNLKASWYNIRFKFDVTKRYVTDIAVDGTTIAENIPFLKNVSHIDEIKLGTSDEAVGAFRIRYAAMYKGFKVREYLEHETSVLPKDWEVIQGKAVVADGTIQPDGSGSGSVVRKTFDREERDTTTNFYIMPAAKGGGFGVALRDGDRNVFEVITTETGFAYKAGDSAAKEFYQRMEGVMYSFRVDTYYGKNVADLYMNNRLIEKNIALPKDITGADNMIISQKGGKQGGAVGMEVYPNITHDDYVPEPVIPEKNSDIELIMQMCPMWTEGYHFGWDLLKSSPQRAPLIGYYDESSPEASDWNIKHMVEHGVDVRESTWYRTSGGSTPVREYGLQNSYEAFQQAKYADKLPWFLKWENSGGAGGSTADESLEYFLKHIAPFWIEYYFKDPNYYKIDGRPVVGFYYWWSVGNVFGSNVKDGIRQFRDLCVKSGVGNPILLGDFDAENISTMEDMGFDIQAAYHRSGSWPEEAEKKNLNDKEKAKGTKVQAMPSVDPGFDSYAWQLPTGKLHNKEQVKKSLEAVRDRYYDGTENNLFGKKLLRLCTWDEYGEGHYFAPTQGQGFDFMDAVYETFVGDKPHTDILPTDAQKDRIVNRYAAWREPVIYYEKPYEKDIPESAEVLASYTFDEDSEDYSALGAKGEIKDGRYVVTATTTTPMFGIDTRNGVEASDITHIKIKAKNNSLCNGFTMWYKTALRDEYINFQTINQYIAPGEEQEIVLPVAKYRALDWRSELKNIQLRFTDFNLGDTLEIDSIEFYGNKPDPTKMKLNFCGYTQYVDGIENGDEAYVPIRKMAWAGGYDDEVYFDAETSTVIYRSKDDGKVVFMPNCNESFTIDGKVYPQDGFVKLIGGTCYVSTQWAQLVYGKTVSYDKETKTFELKDSISVKYERPIEERKLLHGDEFNGSKNNFLEQGDMAVKVAPDSVNLNAGTSADPGFVNWHYGEHGVVCEDVELFAVRIKPSATFLFKIFFTTSEIGSFAESAKFEFPVLPSDDYVVYTFNLKDYLNWKGDLTRVRIDFEQVGNYQSADIDWIRWYGDFETELTDEELAERFDSMQVTEEGSVWNFDINNKRDGWLFNKAIADVSVKEGEAFMNIIADGAEMATVGDLNVNAANAKTIRIRMKNNTDGTKAKLKFITDTSGNYSGDKEFSFEIKANDALGKEYIIHTDSNENWTGVIKGLKFVPSEEKGATAVDYIKLAVK